MPIPSAEELSLRTQLDAVVGRLMASLARCPVIDQTLNDAGLAEADAAINAASADIQGAQTIAAALERLVGATEEALILANVARVNLEVARTAVSLLRAELDHRAAA